MEVHFPAIWLKSITKNDHPYMDAIVILATCPWQKLPYSEIGKRLNLSRKQVKSAVGFLVKKGPLQTLFSSNITFFGCISQGSGNSKSNAYRESSQMVLGV